MTLKRRQLRKRCPTPHKKKYQTKKGAEGAQRVLRFRGMWVSYYRCKGKPKHWHLTGRKRYV